MVDDRFTGKDSTLWVANGSILGNRRNVLMGWGVGLDHWRMNLTWLIGCHPNRAQRLI